MTPLTPAPATDAFRRDPDRFLDVGAGEVAYRRFGTGPDVLFVHGWPVSGATFRTLLPYLVEHVTCHVIDFPGTGSSRFDATTPITLDQHIETVRRVVDQLELESLAVVGHDSGGMIARHALAGDPRVRAWGLVDTEQPQGLGWRFRSFLLMKHVPGVAHVLGWLVGNRLVRRNKFALGDAFADKALLDGEFDELFLAPIHDIPARRDAAARLLRSFDVSYVTALGDLHRRITVPVQLVWGDRDPFFPLAWAREMADTYAGTHLTVIADAKLFVHEERPAEVAAALLPALAGTGTG